MWTCKETGVSKHSRKKIMQLLWTVVSYLLKKNVKHGIAAHDIDSIYRYLFIVDANFL